MDEGLKEATQRKLSFGATMKAVFWSFFGVRKSADYERDLGELNPLHLVIAGLGVAAVFVVLLIVIVRFVIGSGVAA